MQSTAQPVAATVSWWDALMASLTATLTLIIQGVLKLIGFLLIILIGWLLSSWIASAVAAILRKLQFNELATRTGLANVIGRMGARNDASGLIAEVIKWLIRVVVLVVAFSALGLPALSLALNRFILWLPNLVIALAVLLIAGIGANALADLVRGITADAGFRDPDILANVTRIAVWVFAVVISVNQVGIGEALVNTLLIATVASVALAVGLAFGLGGRDLARDRLDQWYKEAQQSRANVEGATKRPSRPSESA